MEKRQIPSMKSKKKTNQPSLSLDGNTQTESMKWLVLQFSVSFMQSGGDLGILLVTKAITCMFLQTCTILTD